VIRKVLMAVAGLVTATMLTVPAAMQASGEKLHISAWAVNMSNIGTGATAQVDFLVDRWSTEAERETLITTMLEQGQDGLLKKLRAMPSHGRMRFPAWQGPDPLHAALGWDLRYTAQTPLPEGGRRIVLALDRYISFWEQRNQPRTIDYPFTLIEMRVDKNGEGEGKMSIATKITFDKKKNVIELENYASEPVRLNRVKVEPRT
jgi:hypothetical protein